MPVQWGGGGWVVSVSMSVSVCVRVCVRASASVSVTIVVTVGTGMKPVEIIRNFLGLYATDFAGDGQ